MSACVTQCVHLCICVSLCLVCVSVCLCVNACVSVSVLLRVPVCACLCVSIWVLGSGLGFHGDEQFGPVDLLSEELPGSGPRASDQDGGGKSAPGSPWPLLSEHQTGAAVGGETFLAKCSSFLQGAPTGFTQILVPSLSLYLLHMTPATPTQFLCG